MPEQKTFVTVKIDEKEIQEKSKIYDTSKIDPHHKMFSYYTELNRAALKLALDDPSIVNDKQNLCNLARQMLHNSGYNYKKKTTRSKQFGESAGAQKREYISDSLKVKRLQEIQEDLTDTDTQMGLLTRQREKHVNVKQFGQAATLTEQILQLREKKRKLQEELTMLQTKKRKCEKQNAKTKSLNASHAKITRFLPQVSNKKPEHVDGQQPTVVGPLVAKITPNSSCRLPDPSDALRHGMGSVEAAKKTCTPSASSSCIQLDPPDALQQGMGSVLDPPDGLEQGMGSVEAAKKTCTPSASSSCIQLDPPDALQQGMGSVLDPPDGLEQGMGSVEAAKKTCTPSAKQPDPPDGLQHAMESDEAPFTPPEVSQILGDNNQTCDGSHFLG